VLRGFYPKLLAKRIELILVGCILFFCIGLGYLTLVKYYTFHTTAWDLGIFSQSVQSTLDRRGFFYNNLELGSHFHVHFQPILFLVVPFYALYPHAPTLLVIQVAALGLAAVPLFFLAKRELGNSRYALVIAIVYLLYPATYGGAYFDYHPESFAPLFGFAALYYFRIGKWPAYFCSLVLLLSVKEDIALVAVGIGLFGLFTNLRSLFSRKVNKTMIFSMVTILVGTVWLYSAMRVTSYFVVSEGYAALWNAGYTHHTGNVYRSIGGDSGLLGIASTIVTNPVRVISQLAYMPQHKLNFLGTLLMPVCMLSFVDLPATVIFLPTLLELLLADNPSYFSIFYHYSFQLTPLIFVAAVMSLKRLSLKANKSPRKTKMLKSLYCLMPAATLIVLCFTLPTIMAWWDAPLTVGDVDRAKSDVVALIPVANGAHVLTESDYFAQVSDSPYSYAYWNTTDVDYILVDLSSGWFTRPDQPPNEYVARYGPQTQSFVDRVKKYTTEGGFGLVAQADGLVLFKRGYTGDFAVHMPYSEQFDIDKLCFNGTVVQDTDLGRNVILHSAGDGAADVFWCGPYTGLPPGEYTAKFGLKVAGTTESIVLKIGVTADSGATMLAEATIMGGDFSEVGHWQQFLLSFRLEKPAFNVEFRGLHVSGTVDVFFDRVAVEQRYPVA